MKGWILHYTKRVLCIPRNSHLFIKLTLNSNLSHKRESRTICAAFLFRSRNRESLLFNVLTMITSLPQSLGFHLGIKNLCRSTLLTQLQVQRHFHCFDLEIENLRFSTEFQGWDGVWNGEFPSRDRESLPFNGV